MAGKSPSRTQSAVPADRPVRDAPRVPAASAGSQLHPKHVTLPLDNWPRLKEVFAAARAMLAPPRQT